MLKFSKYHNLGNDFIIVEESDLGGFNYSKLALYLCASHTGIGADGLIIVTRNNSIGAKYYTRDGSLSLGIGNGIMCLAQYLFLKEECNSFTINNIHVKVIDSEPFRVEINYGSPTLKVKELGININQDVADEYKATIDDTEIALSSVFLSDLHTISRVLKIEDTKVYNEGNKIATLNIFPKLTNVDFVEIVSEIKIKLLTYEKSIGMIYASAVGAAAAVALFQMKKILLSEVEVEVPLGTFHVENRNNQIILITGSEKIFEGEI